MKIKLFVGKGGEVVRYLHHDSIKLPFLGPKEVTRASDVEFDHVKQEWYAALCDGRVIARNKNRDTVLREERKVIEDMLERGEPIPIAVV